MSVKTNLFDQDILIGTSEPNLKKEIRKANPSKNQIKGSQQDDTLRDTQNDDQIFGYQGDDLIYAGKGADTLVGGQGEDTFVIGTKTGSTTLADADWIADFRQGQDLIQLSDYVTVNDLKIFQGTGAYAQHTIIQDGNTGQYLAILKNIKSHTLKPTDFIENPHPPHNKPPKAGNDTLSDSVLLSSRLEIPVADLLANDSDANGDSLTITSVSSKDGIVSLNDGIITFQAKPGLIGPATLKYTVSDGKGGEDRATVELNVVSQVDLENLLTSTDLPVGANGFAILGNTNGSAGWKVSGAADLNGDGLDDLVIGNANGYGEVYVIYGKQDSDAVETGNLGEDGFLIPGQINDFSSGFGFAVSGLGDINGDGFDEALIGTPGGNSPSYSAGYATLVFGGDNTGSNRLRANGIDLYDGAGFSVSDAGDVNGDGLSDFIVSATGGEPGSPYNSDNYNVGESYVIFGQAGFNSFSFANAVDGIGGFVITGGIANAQSGQIVSRAGDVNGDGLSDVLVKDNNSAYVVFGQTDTDPVSLTDVANNEEGFAITGSSMTALSDAGDVNNDGLGDIIVGTQNASYVIFGNPNLDNVALKDVGKKVDGFLIKGEASAVSGAGDVNGDQLDDLIIGTSSNSYIVLGKADSRAIHLNQVAKGKGGLVLNGGGSSVSNAGDVNHDGYADVIVSAANNANGVGAYVFFGSNFNGVSPSVSPVAEDDTISKSVFLSSRLEIAVADLLANDSDPNGDSLTITAVSSEDGTVLLSDDIITFRANRDFAGPATFEYTVSDGKGGTDTATVSLNVVSNVGLGLLSTQTDLPVGVSGFTINAALDAVSHAGDVNNDGLADFIVNEPGVNTSYVVFGKTDTTPVDLAEIASGNGGFVINGAGGAVSSAGDVNNDGFADVIVRNSVIFGKADGTAVDVNDIVAGMGGGFVINPINPDDGAGHSVGGGGDINQDGLADLIVGAPNADPNGLNYAGESYVIFGKTSSTAVELADVAAGNGGFVINGRNAGNRSGYAVSDAGDVNGDGYADVIIGAHLAVGGGGAFEGGGEAYVVFGKPDGDAVELAEVVNGDGGFVINGSDTDDNYQGISVSKAGDINGDGLTDLAVGFYGANGFPGEVYVVFGKTDGTAINPSDLAAGNGGFRIRGFVAYDYYGIDVSTAGDINGDGLDDLIVSNPYAETDMYSNPEVHVGKSYILFGKTDTAEVSVSDLAAGKGGFMLTGADPLEKAGGSVSGGGDVNGDGFADIIIGAPGTSYFPEGNKLESYVMFGGDFTAFITPLGTQGSLSGVANPFIPGIEPLDLSQSVSNPLIPSFNDSLNF